MGQCALAAYGCAHDREESRTLNIEIDASQCLHIMLGLAASDGETLVDAAHANAQCGRSRFTIGGSEIHTKCLGSVMLHVVRRSIEEAA